ncbi:TPA: leucine--tRNA ligase [Candidatus Nomurabacteria bacterium]|nr:MAG: Leucine-tRNA ligase [Candidatus Nomurabacteria bacterium GW2011_GWF2_36_19]KKQ09275.1 MAG: Leucine-tRNA ligase [Candidatus Nomurabacteria bacterium GW2011_GWB1_36_6]KKQ20580.1 MAG: Leucine-tRNA ligase [Candidatus Nomurabacteria bacterium GW2011_GWC2_36_9]KKQ44666.1 MAG: Leucine-tRNA ligase [Candidatus Nomurabacteria bacterium GW2011_GWC1_37_9]OGJ11626.1 MAG: leucine--tRNA ligase [Candidatus Nomurabacteria bacterium RIFOXYD1_FULL_36_19]HAQ02718.1 leucine--tRNA ligase [Candidatus Nomurab
MKNYDHRKIEKKWQGTWEKSKIYEAKTGGKGKPFYGLIEFPYPSGAGLHVGHIRSNTAMDIITRKRRMEGYNVLYPIGWDAFGLPTENYAIKMGIDPAKVTKTNTDIFRKQLKSVGFGFDWSREIDTTDPAYVKWTQWIFLQMYKKGLAYKARTTINWCQSCKIGLANEEVVGGVCERCGGQVVKREKEQWMLAITKYADRLDKDLDKVNYLDKIKIQQRNWIGKSEGSEIEFPVKNSSDKIKVFTTRADTIFGATYVVLAPDHELVTKLKSQISNWSDVEKYVKEVKDKPDIERTAEDKVKTGVELKGVKAVNPANGEEVPIWIADYVLATYGTGAIMAVPQHDERDREFATKFNLPIIDKPLVDAKEITDKVHGKIVTKYKLRDWVFSRQRYWGEPIPIIHCDKCGYVPVPERDLPVVLPKVKSYTPTDNGESPLAIISKWVNTTCPKCKGKAKRETDTMPNWAGSSWYFLRYVDPKNKKEFASKKALTYWMKNGVDWYNGGMEHTTLHLLYSRFWHKFLYDLKVVPTTEPYMKRTSHGMILASGGVKMSKSIGNTIDPKDIVDSYGADTLRIYEMFIGPFDQAVSWNTDSIIGSRRFLDKIWRLGERIGSSRPCLGPIGGKASSRQLESASLQTLLHKTIKKIGEDIESMSFNTAISSMMILVNEMEKEEFVNEKDFKMFLQILAPFAPHITEEIWSTLGEKKSIHKSSWPKWDKKKIVDDTVKIAVQVNGKVRSEIMVSSDADEEAVKNLAIQDKNIIPWIEGKPIRRVIYVKGRIVNIVV